MRSPFANRGGAVALVVVIAVAAGGTVLLVAGDEDDEPPAPPATTAEPGGATPPGGAEREPRRPSGGGDRRDGEDRRGGDDRRRGDRLSRAIGRDERPEDLAERAAARTVRAYVAALDRGAGERVCELLAPGAIERVRLPRDRGDCGASLSASIGYRDPRGLPVWRSGRIGAIKSLEVEGERSKVVATTVTEFADRDEPSVEDDVVYLERDGGRWLIAKPSAILYRAVGIADIPLEAITPP